MYINLNFGLKLKILGPFPPKENYKWAHKTKKKKKSLIDVKSLILTLLCIVVLIKY